MSQPENKPNVSFNMDMGSMMDAINKQVKDKSHVDAVLEMFKEENLDFKTEYPTVKYTKWAVKCISWADSVDKVLDLDENDKEELVREMVHQAMLKMTSHKGRRIQAVVNALKGNDALQNIYGNENKVKRSFFGLGR